MSSSEAAADLPSAEVVGESAGGIHQATLERAIGRIFAIYSVALVLDFWFSSLAVRGQLPRSVAADGLLSLLLCWQSTRAFRRPPSQGHLSLLAAATACLALATRILAVPSSAFLEQDVYLLAVPAAAAWAVWSRRLVAPIPIVLVVIASGLWASSNELAIEQSVTALATVTLAGVAARILRAASRSADKYAERMSQQLASQDVALAVEETERRAANVVHDDVLSVLRAVETEDQPLPWGILVAKAQVAQSALDRQVLADGRGFASLGPALQRQALEFSPALDISCHVDGDLDVPSQVGEALRGASGEALRNAAAHAGVREVMVTARNDGAGGVEVVVRDNGAGFDPARVPPGSTGLRSSVRKRIQDSGGSAEVISAPGEGTAVILKWRPPETATLGVVDSLAWARRIAPRPPLIFLGFMLPILLSSLVLLCLHWQDQRWQLVAVGVYLSILGVAALSARCLSEVRMTGRLAVSLAAANTIAAALGSLAVAPGTTDPLANWVAGDTGIVIAAVYFVRGPAWGLTTLAFDLAALVAALLDNGRAFAASAWLEILISPTIGGAGLAAGIVIAFRSLSRYTETQLAEHRERLRLQARAEAMSRVDSAALENARRVAGPVLALVASGQAPDASMRTAAALANATIRDELLAPGFLTTPLAERVRTARIAGALVTVDFARQDDARLVDTARRLLRAALANIDPGSAITLQVHSAAEGYPPLLILHAHIHHANTVTLRRLADECGALVSDLGDHELLLRLQPDAQYVLP